jgi:hypothetical protein
MFQKRKPVIKGGEDSKKKATTVETEYPTRESRID